jgi:hypothetical protein
LNFNFNKCGNLIQFCLKSVEARAAAVADAVCLHFKLAAIFCQFLELKKARYCWGGQGKRLPISESVYYA